jgi:hypothetical protein
MPMKSRSDFVGTLILASMDWTRVLRVMGKAVEDIGPMPAEGLTIPPC